VDEPEAPEVDEPEAPEVENEAPDTGIKITILDEKATPPADEPETSGTEVNEIRLPALIDLIPLQ